MRTLCLLVLVAPVAFGAVEGMVLNQSTGKPQPDATVTLYRLGAAGMESIESVKSDSQGAFRINQDLQGPHLIQTAYDGVTYNHMLPPGSPATALKLEVYNSSPSQPPGAKVTQHMVLLEPTGGELQVNESIIFQNTGTITFNDPNRGTLRVYLPEETKGKTRVMASAPQGMPIERAAEKTSQPNVYKIDFPVKPGETRFDLTYSMPFSNPGVFSSRALHNGGPVRIVAPEGVTLQGAALTLLGQEPNTHASIYEVKGGDYQVQVNGAGNLRAPSGGAEEEDGGSGIQQIPARIYDRMYAILGLAFLILLLGFLLLYRSRVREAPAAPAAAPPQKGRRR